LSLRRPPVEIRNKLDLAYRIEGQSIMLYSIRPRWDNPAEIIEEPVAKDTFVTTQQAWKVYWMRADLKWHSFTPKPTVKSIKAFIKLVNEDKFGCFFG
jgi:hypothetical protein